MCIFIHIYATKSQFRKHEDIYGPSSFGFSLEVALWSLIEQKMHTTPFHPTIHSPPLQPPFPPYPPTPSVSERLAYLRSSHKELASRLSLWNLI